MLYVVSSGDQVNLRFDYTGPDVGVIVMPFNYTENNDLSNIDRIRIELIRFVEGTTVEFLDISTTLDHSVRGDMDFDILTANFDNTVFTPQLGDANHDRVVNLDDFGILALHFGQSHVTPGETIPAAAIPGPVSAAFLLMIGIAFHRT